MWFREEKYSMDVLRLKPDEEILAFSITHPDYFEILLERYQDAFVRKAQSIVYSKEDAEEVVLESFAKIYQYAGKFTPEEGASFKSWGYRILINTACTRYQKLKKERGAMSDLDHEIYELLPDTEARQFEKGEVRDLVVSVLSKLPEHMQRVLSAYFIDGLAQQEIAQLEGTSLGAIKTRMHRAKLEFRNVYNNITM